MATFHISFKKLRRSEGKSSVYLSAYQNREKTKDNRTGATWDYSKKRGIFRLCYPLPCRHTCRTGEGLRHPLECRRGWREAKGCRIMSLCGHSHPQGAGRRPEEADRPRLLPRKFRGLWNDCRHSIS